MTEDKKVDYSEAEAMLLGISPNVEEAPEPQTELKEFPPDPKDWTDEDRARVAEIMKQLHFREEPEPETNLREHFTKGETLVDPNGLRTRIRNVGKGAMTVNLLAKKGRFVDGFEITIRGFIFMTSRSKGNRTCLQLQGVVPQQEVSDGATRSK